jgi:hypothetical protein
MVIGGLIINAETVEKFNNTIQKFRIEQKMFSELKWTKVSNQKIDQYKRFIEYFFALNNTDVIHFHSIVIDNHQVDYKKFSKGDKELGFYKFYYQLLLHCFGKEYYREDEDVRFIIHLDYRNTSYRLNTLKNILNNGIKKKYGAITAPFVSIEPRNSKLSDLIQLNDILVGAIGFEKNGYDLLAGTRDSKKELAKFVSLQAGLKNLKENTIWGMKRFTIWNFRLRK